MRFTTSLKLGLGGVLLAGATLGVTGIAAADYEPSSTDVVAVTGDTPQFALQFLSDGDYNGDAGFNASGSYNKLVSFNATADGNARSAYAQGSTESSPIALNPTDVLRAGTFPVQRVQSSGAAITALLNDTSSQETINFIGSSSLPTSAQQNQAATNGWGYLHVVELGTDAVQIATASTTNAPAGLSAAELVKIYNGTYTTWNQLPGNSSGSTDTIIPEIPPSSSAIYKTLVADLKSANGGTAVSLGSDVKTVEQNDPTAITGATTPADAIVPFSLARFNLWSDGYFHNPATVFPGSTTALSSGIKLLSGTAPDAGSAYSSAIADYVIFRQSDASSTTAFEPGGTKNWVQTLFSNSGGTSPLVKSAIGQSLIAASGVTPNYQDLGDVSAG